MIDRCHITYPSQIGNSWALVCSEIGKLIDLRKKDVAFFDETDDEVTARVRVNLEAMRRWALQYGPHVRVLSPESLVNDIRHDIALTAGKNEGST